MMIELVKRFIVLLLYAAVTVFAGFEAAFAACLFMVGLGKLPQNFELADISEPLFFKLLAVAFSAMIVFVACFAWLERKRVPSDEGI